MIHKVNLAGSGTFDPVTGTYVSEMPSLARCSRPQPKHRRGGMSISTQPPPAVAITLVPGAAVHCTGRMKDAWSPVEQSTDRTLTGRWCWRNHSRPKAARSPSQKYRTAISTQLGWHSNEAFLASPA